MLVEEARAVAKGPFFEILTIVGTSHVVLLGQLLNEVADDDLVGAIKAAEEARAEYLKN